MKSFESTGVTLARLRLRSAAFALGRVFTLALFLTAARRNVEGQDIPGRLMDQPPFDVLTLDRTNDNQVFKLYPIPLPGRRIPEKPKSADTIRVRLMDSGEEYDVAWRHIEKLELYEQMVLAETRRFIAEGKLDDAFDSLEFLFSFYPQTPGLAEVRQSFLYASSAAAFRDQKFDEALSLLEELWSLNPNFRIGDTSASLLSRLDTIADRLLARLVAAQDYRAARALLARLSKQYKAENEPFARKWRDELVRAAGVKLAEARTHFEAGKFVEAHEACAQALAIWPELAGATSLAADIGKKHPLVRVGVSQPVFAADPLSLHDPAARRVGRLQSPMLVERAALGVEGGTYISSVGKLERSDDGVSLSFQLANSSRVSAYTLAEHLLRRAMVGDEDFESGWARRVKSVSIPNLNEVWIDFRSPPLLPEARLQLPLSRIAKPNEPLYRVLSKEPAPSKEGQVARWMVNDKAASFRSGQPAEIIERHFTDPQRAILALKRGEIDVLDQVFPGDVPALKGDESLRVEPYGGPTTHLLAVRSNDPFLQNATFRRALVYAVNRELLLSQGLLRGAKLPGFRTVSSPFPAPVNGLELPAYAYDERIEPRAYDPPLAKALVLLAENELRSAYQKLEKEVPKRRTLVIGHPADEVARIASRGIAKDWKRLGVEAKLVEFPSGVFDDVRKECDLVYLQLAAWEPLIDAGRLLAADGLAPASSPAIQLLLREVESAPNWPEARRRLTTLHRLLHEDVTLLPLWQTVDHYAFRRGALPAGAKRLSLYQDIETWHPAAARPQP